MGVSERLTRLRDRGVLDIITGIVLAEKHRLSPRSIEAVRSVLEAMLQEATRPQPLAVVRHDDRPTDPVPSFDEDEPTEPGRHSSKHPKPRR